MEDKHRNLAKSYNQVEGSYARLQQEVEELREELLRWRPGSGSRESSILGTPTQMSTTMEDDGALRGNSLFDPFATDNFFGCSAGQGTF